MLVAVTHNGASLVDPASFKNPPSSFPISSSLKCSTGVWSPDNSQLYLASSSSIKRYTPSECLLEVFYHASDTVTCMEMKGKDNIHFAAANKVWSLDCTRSPGRAVSSLQPHENTITRISVSNDGTLLASVSASAVFVHNLTRSSHTQLKGLPDGNPVTCCLFHQHSRTRLLLSVGEDLVVYDSTRTSSPLKVVRIPGGGEIVDVTTSPFSKTFAATVTSNGDVVLVDLDKDNGILKSVNVKATLTCCAFTTEGAAIYLGTDDGKLLILDLRSLEKEPKSFVIGDGNAPVKAINVQGTPKSRTADTSGTKVRSSSTASANVYPQRSTSSRRTASTSSVVVGSKVKSPARVTVTSRGHGGGGVTPKRKQFSPSRTPLSETKNVGLNARLAGSHSPLTRRVKPLKFQRDRKHGENDEVPVSLPSPTFSGSTELADARQSPEPRASHRMGQAIKRLGLGPAPESISGHLAALRVRSSSTLNEGGNDGDRPRATTRRVISESVKNASDGRKGKGTSSASTRSRVSSRTVSGATRTRQQQERSTTPDKSYDHLDLPSPELPREPVTPISLGKNAPKAPSASATGTGTGVLGLTSPEVAKWAKGETQKEKGKDRAIEVKKTRFAHPEPLGESDNPEDEGGPELVVDEGWDGEQEQELSLQVSPRRPAAPPAWLQSPHRSSSASLNMNAAAQDFLRGIVRDVVYDCQRETKAEMMGLHLDLVRMGRGWKQELREIMEEWSGEIRELKAENKRLREENERLRRGY